MVAVKPDKPEEMIQLYTVNGGKPSALIPLRRYEAMRKAVLAALKKVPEGLGFHDLAIAASQHLPVWWSREGWDEIWHATNVKLHLEYLGELERVPGAKPHRVRIKGYAGATGRSSRVGARLDSPLGVAAAPVPRIEADARQGRLALPMTSTLRKPKSPKEMGEAMAKNLPQRTGRSLADWIKIVRAEGLTDWREAEQWLKREHGLTTMYAYMVAGAALTAGTTDYGDEAGLLANMYSGPREALRPIHSKLWKLAQSLGPEVEQVVCKTYSSFRAKSQFAVVQPTTQSIVDLALALPPDSPAVGRLESCRAIGGGEKNKHRIRLEGVKEIDAEVKRWLKAAYEWNTGKVKK